eukprot:TRINITY_DN5837_c1_g1_i1.p1 TRINITY_DN5837_c1_g1~~TRINITY_DN5837_c1_g1_i1.p1  ORF type:complete len:1285 (-),score=140.78 TRINITY_DN5837_c1_g1_i1:83-3937(-)
MVMRLTLAFLVIAFVVALCRGQGPGTWSNNGVGNPILNLWWPRVVAHSNRFCSVWQTAIGVPSGQNKQLIAVSGQGLEPQFFASWPSELLTPPPFNETTTNFVSWYDQYGLVASKLGCFVLSRSTDAVQLHFLNTSSGEPQIWGQFPAEQLTGAVRLPELLWSSALPSTASYDSWAGAEGSDRVMFLGVTETHVLNATIILHDNINMKYDPVTVTSVEGKIISPAAGFCSNKFYTVYFETITSNTTSLKLAASLDHTAQNWSAPTILHTTSYVERGSISEIICMHNTSMAFAVRYGATRYTHPGQSASIVVYVVDPANFTVVNSVTIASSLIIESDLWAGLSLAQVSDWLALKFSAQETTYTWRSFYSFASAQNPSRWSSPLVVEPPTDKLYLNQSSIQQSLACNGTHCMSPNTRVLGRSFPSSAVESGAFWQSFSIYSSCSPISPICFSGLGCNSSCACSVGFKPDSFGQCRRSCGDNVTDEGEECDGSIGCNSTTCTCNADEGYLPIGGVCVQACVNTLVTNSCPQDRPYRCGGCCSVIPCQNVVKRCPDVECFNGTCAPFSSVPPVCGLCGELTTCANGMCASNLGQCPPASSCPIYSPQCPDGTCGCSNYTDSCFALGKKKCIDGMCRDDCDGLRTFGCPPPQLLSPTGVCVRSLSDSGTDSTGLFKCHNGKEGTIYSCPTPLIFIGSVLSTMSIDFIPQNEPVDLTFLARGTSSRLLSVRIAEDKENARLINLSVSQLTYMETIDDLVDQSMIISIVAQVTWNPVPLSLTLDFSLDYWPDTPVCLWSLASRSCIKDIVLSKTDESEGPFATITGLIPPGRYAMRINPTPPPIPPTSGPFGLIGLAAIVALGVIVVVLIALLMYVSMRYRAHRKKAARMGTVVDRSQRKSTANGPDNAWNLYTALPAFSESFLKRDFPHRFISMSNLHIGEKIGQGSYSTVYGGKWGERLVAVKVADRGVDTDYVCSLRKEAKILINLAPHPNIIHVYGVAEDEKCSYLVMEYCHMGSVQRLRKKGKLSDLTDQYRVMLNVARALAHLHSFKIVHRDVAARNILLTETSEVRLSDFGMSRRLPKGQKFGTFRSKHGPVRWMAPECFMLRQFSPASDVWAFANTVCEILSGLEPFHDEVPEEVANAVRDHGTHPKIPNNCPHWLKKVLASCWRIKPEDRPSMQKIADRIAERVLPGRPKARRRKEDDSEASSAKSTEMETLRVYDSDGDGPPTRRDTVTGLGLGALPPHPTQPLEPAPVARLVDTETFTDALEDSETYGQIPTTHTPRQLN